MTSTANSCCQRAIVHRLVTQPGWFANMLCFGHVAAYFLLKRFYILDTCVIFYEIMFFKALSAFIALYSNFSKCGKALYHSAFTQFYLSKCLFFILLSMECVSAIIWISRCEVLNFLIMLWDFLIFLYVLVSVLIMFKTSRFWPLVDLTMLTQAQ